MSTIQEIEQAVEQLPPETFAAFRAWFFELEARRWDEQIERDIQDGKLEALAEEALKEFREGWIQEL